MRASPDISSILRSRRSDSSRRSVLASRPQRQEVIGAQIQRNPGMLIVRVYALYARDRRILMLTVGVALAAIANGCVSSVSSS